MGVSLRGSDFETQLPPKVQIPKQEPFLCSPPLLLLSLESILKFFIRYGSGSIYSPHKNYASVIKKFLGRNFKKLSQQFPICQKNICLHLDLINGRSKSGLLNAKEKSKPKSHQNLQLQLS